MAKKSTIIQAKYDRDNTKKYTLKLNLHTDKDIIAKIEKTAKDQDSSIQGAIKYLIRKSEI